METIQFKDPVTGETIAETTGRCGWTKSPIPYFEENVNINAKQAGEISIQNSQQDVDRVNVLIKNAASKGMCQVEVPDMTSATKLYLENNGFTFKGSHYYNVVVVCWDKN